MTLQHGPFCPGLLGPWSGFHGLVEDSLAVLCVAPMHLPTVPGQNVFPDEAFMVKFAYNRSCHDGLMRSFDDRSM